MTHEYGLIANRLLFIVLFTGAALAVSARPATATSLVYQTTGRGHVVQVAIAAVSKSKPVWAAELDWIWGDGEPPPDYGTYNPSFYTYCVELFNSLGSEDLAVKSTNLLTVSGVPDAGGKGAWLFNTYAGAIHTRAYAAAAQKFDARVNAAALQVAIWESLLDSSSDLRNGTFKLNTSGLMTSRAMQYLSALYSGDATGDNTGAGTWLDTEDTKGQSILPGVPEPGTLVMLGTGLIAAWTVRRRRQRQPAA